MKYSSGYKHQVREQFTVQLFYFRPKVDIDTWYCHLTVDGVLTVKEHFAWDGASGPTWDTKATMTPSCVHDVLAKLMRHELLPHKQWKLADLELDHLLKQRGVWKIRRSGWLWGLSLTEGSYAKPKNKRRVYEVT